MGCVTRMAGLHGISQLLGGAGTSYADAERHMRTDSVSEGRSVAALASVTGPERYWMLSWTRAGSSIVLVTE